MKRAYIITGFDIKTDIKMKYQLKNREIYYSEEDVLYNIKYLLENIHEEYQEITNSIIQYDEFYNKFKPDIEISVISLNHKSIITEYDYNEYLKEIKALNKDELYDYLLDCVSCIKFTYDYNLNLLQTNTQVDFNDPYFNDYYKQFSFSYKALFPEKYHVNKFNAGDKVKYLNDNKEYLIISVLFGDMTENIYEAKDPLNYLYGYYLYNEDEDYCIPDDKFGYLPVDEDLVLID